ncbi:MAG TPA: hypothetical protein VFP84_12140 [Kofleriaceae bacterium]|nr:hypothetical protein [Kofleriaceae bacterium]
MANLLCFSFIFHTATAAPDSKISNYTECEYHLLSNGDSDRVFNEKHVAISVFAVLPIDAEMHRKVYGKNAIYSSDAKREFDDARARISNLSSKIVKLAIDSGKNSQQEFTALLAASKDKTLVIVGHNDDGNFAFADGTTMQTLEMAKQCSTHNAFCIFLTCEAESLNSEGCAAGADCKITAKEATLSLAKAVDNVFPNKDAPVGVSGRDLWNDIDRNIRSSKHASLIRYVMIAGVVVAIIVIIHKKNDDDEKNKKRAAP